MGLGCALEREPDRKDFRSPAPPPLVGLTLGRVPGLCCPVLAGDRRGKGCLCVLTATHPASFLPLLYSAPGALTSAQLLTCRQQEKESSSRLVLGSGAAAALTPVASIFQHLPPRASPGCRAGGTLSHIQIIIYWGCDLEAADGVNTSLVPPGLWD